VITGTVEFATPTYNIKFTKPFKYFTKPDFCANDSMRLQKETQSNFFVVQKHLHGPKPSKPMFFEYMGVCIHNSELFWCDA